MHAIVTVGISASGKSSYAGMLPTYIEVNRDDIRFGIVMPEAKGWKDYEFSDKNEAAVSRIQYNMMILAKEAGENIIISDTNTNNKTRRSMIGKLKSLGYSVEVVVIQIEEEEAIKRDSFRGNRSVGEETIKRQYQQFQNALPIIERDMTTRGYTVSYVDNN